MITEVLMASVPAFPSCGGPKWIPQRGQFSSHDGQPLDKAKKVKILVIDDEALIAETVMEILNHEGFEATAASTGAEGWARSRSDGDPDGEHEQEQLQD